MEERKQKWRERHEELRANECNYGRAFRLLEERWTFFVLYHLGLGASGFNELRRAMPSISPTLLSARLEWLQESGLVERQVQSLMPPRTSYGLTPAGHALKPILDELAQWSAEYLSYDIGLGEPVPKQE